MTAATETKELSKLAIREGQVEFDSAQKKALIDVLRVRHATDADLNVFFHMAARTQLDPFRRQLYCIARQEWNSETRQKEWVQTYQTGIDGYRVVAQRSAARMHMELKKARFEYWDAEGNVSSAWWKTEPPAMVRATVQLGDQEPVIWDARYWEYVPLKDEYEDVLDKDGKPVKVNGKTETRKTGKRVPQGMWATRPTAQLEKCAEAGALRRAFTEDLSNLWVDAEMQQPEEPITTLVDDGAATTVVNAPPSGRDWVAAIETATTGEEASAIFQACKDAGERTSAFDDAVQAAVVRIREAETASQGSETLQDETVETVPKVETCGAETEWPDEPCGLPPGHEGDHSPVTSETVIDVPLPEDES